MTAAAPATEELPALAAAWPAELRVLVRLLRVALRTAPAEVAVWPADVNTTAFNACMDRHRVGPFLHQRLPAEARAALPEAVRHRLAVSARLNARRALMRVGELARLVQLLEGHGIPVTSVKGPLLARQLYGDLGARHSGDLDLLLAPAHAGRADQLLRAAGYSRSAPDFELTPRQLGKYLEVRHEFEYFSADGRNRLELMWRLGNHAPLTQTGDAPHHCELGGRRIAVLAPETEALYLLLHGARHGWFRLFWLLDMALLLQGRDLDWPRLARRAGELRMERPLWQGVWLAGELFGMRLPEVFSAPPPDEPVLRRLVDDACRHILLSPDELKSGAAHWWMTGYLLRLQSSMWARWRVLQPRYVAPADWKTLPLPDRWFALYYVLWPLLWLKRRLGP